MKLNLTPKEHVVIVNLLHYRSLANKEALTAEGRKVSMDNYTIQADWVRKEGWVLNVIPFYNLKDKKHYDEILIEVLGDGKKKGTKFKRLGLLDIKEDIGFISISTRYTSWRKVVKIKRDKKTFKTLLNYFLDIEDPYLFLMSDYYKESEIPGELLLYFNNLSGVFPEANRDLFLVAPMLLKLILNDRRAFTFSYKSTMQNLSAYFEDPEERNNFFISSFCLMNMFTSKCFKHNTDLEGVNNLFDASMESIKEGLELNKIFKTSVEERTVQLLKKKNRREQN